MSDTDKRADYLRRAEEAREAAKATPDINLKLVLLKLAKLWERLGLFTKAAIAAAIPTAGACAALVSECCIRMHFHCLCCLFHI